MKKRLMAGVLLLLLMAGYVAWALWRPLGPLAAEAVSLTAPASQAALSWPGQGQAAVGVLDSDILETHGAQTPAPMASTAKVITALVVLEAKPLAVGQPGPTITLTDRDVALYHAYVAQDGSIVPVTAGEQITEYQALQAVMLPSSNNLADSLAIWAYGSLEAYRTAANAYLAAHGLRDTTVGSDASGMSPTTVSTAADLVRLGQLAMRQTVLAEIAGQAMATGIPNTSVIRNVNSLLGTSGIIGLKTGNTDQAGGVFISASRITLDGRPVTLITSVMGAQSLWHALNDSLALVRSAQANFKPVTVVKAGQVVGSYRQPWGGSVEAVAVNDLVTTVWLGRNPAVKVNLDSVPVGSGPDRAVGTVVARSFGGQSTSVSVKLERPTTAPAPGWRFSHP